MSLNVGDNLQGLLSNAEFLVRGDYQYFHLGAVRLDAAKLPLDSLRILFRIQLDSKCLQPVMLSGMVQFFDTVRALLIINCFLSPQNKALVANGKFANTSNKGQRHVQNVGQRLCRVQHLFDSCCVTTGTGALMSAYRSWSS